MPKPSKRDRIAARRILELHSTQHYAELTRLAEKYNKVVEFANLAASRTVFEKYYISDYLDRLLTEQQQISKTMDMGKLFGLIAYRTDLLNCFAFDDARVGLKGELFVPSASAVLDMLAKLKFGQERDTFGVVFSAELFPGFQARAQKLQGAEDAALRAQSGLDLEVLTKDGRYAVAAAGDEGGTYYRIDLMQTPFNPTIAAKEFLGKHLWLCDALRKYFPVPPERIYVEVTEVEEAECVI